MIACGKTLRVAQSDSVVNNRVTMRRALKSQRGIIEAKQASMTLFFLSSFHIVIGAFLPALVHNLYNP